MPRSAMTTETRLVEITLCSALDNVPLADSLARRVSAEAGLSEEDIDKMEMAVHESTINAIVHGNRNEASKQVRLQFQITGDRLVVRIRDEGPGFDLEKLADPRSSENLLKACGRGIFLIRAFVDEFSVKRTADSGNEVTLIKNLNKNTQPQEGGRQREHEGHRTSS